MEQIASHIDMLPTLLELCGLAKPEGLLPDGVSIKKLLEGETEDWPDRMIFTFKFPRGEETVVPGSVRTQRWRALKGGGGKWKGVWIYDLRFGWSATTAQIFVGRCTR